MTDTSESGLPAPKRGGGVLRRLARALNGAIVGADHAAEEAVVEAMRARDGRGQGPVEARKDMILNAALFDQLRVRDVMTPRADIVAIEADFTLGEAARVFIESQHSRLPVYRGTLDDPLGFVHVKDVLKLVVPEQGAEGGAKLGERVLGRLRRDILFVPDSMTLSTLLLKMQSRRIHLALVVDEYGGTDGIVSIEDIVEQIVGDIADEYDEEDKLVQPRPGGAFEADGRAPVEELETALGASLALPEEEGEYDTAGGLVVVLAGRLPQRGEVLEHPAGFVFEILESDPRRVKRLRVRPATPKAPAPAAGRIG